MAVHPGRGYEPGEALQELERGEEDFRSPVGPLWVAKRSDQAMPVGEEVRM